MKNVAGSGETISGALTLGGRVYHTLGASYMTTDTVDGTDNKLIALSSAGDVGIARGASIVMRGNEYPDGDAGKMKLYAASGFFFFSGASLQTTLDTTGSLTLPGTWIASAASNSIVMQHANPGRMALGDTLSRGALLSWSPNALNLGFNMWEDGNSWQGGVSGAGAVFRVQSGGSFSWVTKTTGTGYGTEYMTLSNSGNLNVVGTITASNIKSLSAFGVKSASQGVLGGSSLTVYKRTITVDGVTVNVLTLD